MRSLYNLALGKPNVQFFEGIEEVKRAIFRSLSAHTEILAYSGIDNLVLHLKKYALWYAGERRRKEIHERSIIPDTPVALEYMKDYSRDVTEILFVPHKEVNFDMEINVYDNIVFYSTFREPFIAVMIEDKEIANAQRAIFELNWKWASTLPMNKKSG